MKDWEATEGSPRPLGISLIVPQQAWNFALYSKHASAVSLHLFHKNDLQTPQYTYPFNPWLGQPGGCTDYFCDSFGATTNALMQRLYGSDDLFPDSLMEAYHAYQSVNFITAHDGFTLYDLVSFNHKHNEINGYSNIDGSDHNFSWNCGREGDTSVPDAVMHLRKRQIKNFCCLLLLANGTPMIRAGDEFMQTQSGNNNPYNQDNEINWLN